MNELALFAGAGGGILGGKLLGWRTVCAVEWEPYAAGVLAARQNDKVLEPFPIWDDVQTFDGTPWRGIVDVVSGGFPCQDISSAGKGAGIDGERSGMWKHMARVVCEVKPRWVFVENSPMLTIRGMGTVLRDLAEMGFDAAWGVLGAGHLGAPHIRERAWIVGHAMQGGRAPESLQPEQALSRPWAEAFAGPSIRKDYAALRGGWEIEPAMGRVVDGMADGMDRIAALGNGQVPRVAAAAFAILAEQLMTPNSVYATSVA
jgi:DNA (cytosine-5)-methyltransferase 1